jgi:hypothetical protein
MTLGLDADSLPREELLTRQLPGLSIQRLPDPRVSCWLNLYCESCNSQLAIVPTTDSVLDADNFEIVCPSCGLTVPAESLLDMTVELDGLPVERTIGPEKYGRGREDSIVFGKGLGSSQEGKARSEVLRYAIDMANGWKWDPKRPNGSVEVAHLYGLKAFVGVHESKTMKSALEMMSRKIRKVEAVRGTKVPQADVQRIGNLIRKGMKSAEKHGTTSTRERKLIVQQILRTENLWPP